MYDQEKSMAERQEKSQTRGEARRQAILEAATDLFLKKGYAATSLSDIIHHSKGSRSTVYTQFGSKEGLLCAMVREITLRVWRVIQENDNAGLCGNVEDYMVGLARRFLMAAVSPLAIAVNRILAAEGRRLPEISHLFFKAGPMVVEEQLAVRFQAIPAVRRGEIEPEAAVRIFLGMVVSGYFFRCTLGLVPPPGEEEMDLHVRTAVHIFLRGLDVSPQAPLASFSQETCLKEWPQAPSLSASMTIGSSRPENG